MNGLETVAALRALAERFRGEEERLNRLDQPLGDGDHGATVVRGLAAVENGLSTGSDRADAGAILTRAGSDFLAATGGASGILFATLFRELGANCGRTLDAAAFRDGLSAATDQIMRLGKASPGDKTMIDALVPAREAIDGMDGDLESFGSLLTAAAVAAEQGAVGTSDMVARRGRARYVPEGGRGHADPGATSVAMILRTLAEQAERVT